MQFSDDRTNENLKAELTECKRKLSSLRLILEHKEETLAAVLKEIAQKEAAHREELGWKSERIHALSQEMESKDGHIARLTSQVCHPLSLLLCSSASSAYVFITLLFLLRVRPGPQIL